MREPITFKLSATDVVASYLATAGKLAEMLDLAVLKSDSLNYLTDAVGELAWAEEADELLPAKVRADRAVPDAFMTNEGDVAELRAMRQKDADRSKLYRAKEALKEAVREAQRRRVKYHAGEGATPGYRTATAQRRRPNVSRSFA